MAASTAIAESESIAGAASKAPAGYSTLPWFIYLAALGVTGIPAGVLWDISWHSTIGRDTFWTPAHILIHLGGLIPGLTCTWLIFKTTFWGSDDEKAASVGIWGFRGPLGAWVVIWGNLAMLTSAPFDDWWHDAYGLDVEILSPPHTVLALGMYGVALGCLLLVLGWQNRLAAGEQRRASRLFLHVAGLLITMMTIMMTEESFPNHQHSGTFYILSAAVFPFYFAMIARSATVRWSATFAATTYVLLVGGAVWILPLFKAQPLLAPIYNPVDRMVPPAFPLLLFVPALAFDLIVQRFGRTNPRWWKLPLIGAALSLAFLLTFLPTQWFFSEFLLSEASRNAFFAGSGFFPYFTRPGAWQHEFWLRNSPVPNLKSLSLALGAGFIAACVGLAVGGWMSRVRR